MSTIMFLLKDKKEFESITGEDICAIMKTVLNFYTDKLWWLYEMLKLIEVII